MRDITANLAVFLALLGFLTSESRPESIGKPAAGRIAQLINQLGSKKFQERELAAGVEQQILATAVYSDGTLRDVTAASLYSGNAPHIVDIEADVDELPIAAP